MTCPIDPFLGQVSDERVIADIVAVCNASYVAIYQHHETGELWNSTEQANGRVRIWLNKDRTIRAIAIG